MLDALISIEQNKVYEIHFNKWQLMVSRTLVRERFNPRTEGRNTVNLTPIPSEYSPFRKAIDRQLFS